MKRDFAFAVKAIIIKEDRFLVLHRSPEEIESSILNKHEAWDLPGGGVHFFETTERALFREVKEETSIKVRLIKLMNAYDAIRTALHLVILTYICQYTDGDVALSNEHDRFYWLTLNEMQEMNLPHWMIRDFRNATEELMNIANLEKIEQKNFYINPTL
ncbi:MAG: NUDIX domain-containing protein [Lachnospiraceae bacterium]|nr:NUDIX domain-containing protein [Lachnospiraceae bacterium]